MQRLRSAVVGRVSQVDLAERVGTTAPTLSRWLSGSREPDLATFGRLCQALGVSADVVLGVELVPAGAAEREVVRVPVLRDAQALDQAGALEAADVVATYSGPAKALAELLGGPVWDGRCVWIAGPAVDGGAQGWPASSWVLVDRHADGIRDGQAYLVRDVVGGRWVARRCWIEGRLLICAASESSSRAFTVDAGGEPLRRYVAGRVAAVLVEF